MKHKKLNKKGALEPDKYLTGILLFSIVMIIGLMMVQDTNSNYDDIDMLTDDFEKSSNLSSDVYNLSQDIKESIYDKDLDEDDTPSSMFAGAYKALRFFAGSFTLVGGILTTTGKLGLIHPALIVPIITLITILVVMSVVYLVFRFQPRS